MTPQQRLPVGTVVDENGNPVSTGRGGGAGPNAGAGPGAGPVGTTVMPPEPTSKATSFADLLTSALPWLGGTVGGAIGGIGGTVAGFGVGGVPGAVGGAALGGAAGESARKTIDALRGKPLRPSAGADAADIGMAAVEQGGAELAGQGLAAAAKPAGRWLMGKAVKPSLSQLENYRTDTKAIANTMLKAGSNVTDAGVSRLDGLLSATQKDLDHALSLRTDTPIKPHDVVAPVAAVRAKFGNQVNPTADLKAIDQVSEEFMHHPNFPGQYPIQNAAQAAVNPLPKVTRDLSLSEAQELKKGTYRALRGKYGEQGSAEVEAQKGIARGLREAIERELPSVKGMNAKEAELMAAIDAAGRRVALAGGSDPIGLGWATHNPATFVAHVLLKSPASRGFLALGLYDIAAKQAGVSANALRAALHALVSVGADEPKKDQ